MGEIIKWMNDNNGFIMGLLTLVYVIATILICVFNFKSAKATRLQTAESKRQFAASNRPNIIPCFTMVEGALFCLTFKNIGNECAKNLRISINEAWISCFNKALQQKAMPGDMVESLKNSFFIEPEGEIKFVLMIPGDGTTMYQEISKEKIEIQVEYYRNDLSDKFTEAFEMDLLSMASMILDKSDYVRKMEKQEKALKSIAEKIDQLNSTYKIIQTDLNSKPKATRQTVKKRVKKQQTKEQNNG